MQFICVCIWYERGADILGTSLPIFSSESGGSAAVRPGVGDGFAVAGRCAVAADVFGRAQAAAVVFLPGGMSAFVCASASSLADVSEVSSPSECGGECPWAH